MNLDYLKTKHGYEIGKLWYPRVTSICQIIGKPGLERWLANQGSFAAMQQRRKKITSFGSLVHNIAEEILTGRDPGEIPLAIQPSIEALRKWLKSHKVKVYQTEKRVVSRKYLYAGTIDALGEIDGTLGILDLKTSTSIWDEYFLQTAAYLQAHNESHPQEAKTHWILRIDQYQECLFCGALRRDRAGHSQVKGGSFHCLHQWGPVKGVCQFQEIEDHQTYFKMFLAAKKLWEFSNRSWLKQIPNYPKKFYSNNRLL